VTVAVEVVTEPRRAQALLHPVRIALLENLAEPASAAALARRMGAPRQRINYHLRELESQRLIELVEEKKKGSATERIYRRAGRGYAISTAALGSVGPEPAEVEDHFSSLFQIALASRAIRELATMQAAADAAKKKLPTFALEVDVRFGSAERRDAFAEELAANVADLVRKYHGDKTPRGRSFRFYLGSYPRPKKTQR
jgi:DNA-binding transcriptional ArsR family regulator